MCVQFGVIISFFSDYLWIVCWTGNRDNTEGSVWIRNTKQFVLYPNQHILET